MSHEAAAQVQPTPNNHPLFKGSILKRKCPSCGKHKTGSGTCTKCQSRNHVKVPSDLPFIQPKLTIGCPDDKYEREADRVAEKVMRMPAPESNSVVGAQSQIPQIQRRYANCEEGKMLQAKEMSGATPEVTPAIASRIQSLQSSGQPLSIPTRNFFEPRFGQDFSHVRVHNDDSAKALRARAYTIGNHIVFGSSQYAPKTTEGKRLLAHELTHIVQQKSTDNQIQRWAISGNTATANSPDDVLWGLARSVGASGYDWPCIVPLSMRTARMATQPANFNEHYELYVQIGDEFDVSNLLSQSGPTLLIHLFNNARDVGIATLFYPGMVASSGDVDINIENAASDGITPIENMVIFGHASGTNMFGEVGSFDPSTLTPEPHTFALANAKLLPRRCWFSRNARVRAVGCSSTAFAREFSRAYLRRGSVIRSTTSPVSPCCHGVWDQLAFTTSSAAGSTILDGPFRTTGDFHRSRFWESVDGRL